MGKQRSIRDPLHGFVPLSEQEWHVVNAWPFQRLRDICQLGMGHMVYPGANHTRFEHSLGVLELSSRYFDQLVSNCEPEYATEIFGDGDTRMRLRRTLRLAALLHDLGHAPFSHAGEELFIPAAHKDLEKLDPKRLHQLRREYNHETMTARIMRETELRERVVKCDVDLEEVIYVATASDISTIKDFRPDLDLLNQLITGELGSDRCDYLLRDAYHSGQPGGRFDLDRVLQQTTIVEREGALYLGLREGGRIAAEQLIASRYAAYANLYFHKAKRAYELHLVRFLKDWLPEGRLPHDLDGFLRLTDSDVITGIKSAAQSTGRKSNIDAWAFRDRSHFRVARQFLAGERRAGDGKHGARTIPEEAIKEFAKNVRELFGNDVFVDILNHTATKIRGTRTADKILVDVDGKAQYLEDLSEIVSGMDEKIWCLRVHSSVAKKSKVRRYCSDEWQNLKLRQGA